MKTKIVLLLFLLLRAVSVFALNQQMSEGEQLYNELSDISKTNNGSLYFENINHNSNKLDWENGEEISLVGNLRIIKNDDTGHDNIEKVIYLIRSTKGELILLSIPPGENIKQKSESTYSGLVKMLESKMQYQLKTKIAVIDKEAYTFARFTRAPEKLIFDIIFKISIVLMLFLVMAGMGMTLAVKDFTNIAKKPRGILAGMMCQFLLMPVVAFGLGHFLGYNETFPYIFVGMILVTATPGGATSNLMTYFAKGDLALSISMTALATVLSLFVTPLLLVIFCANIPNIQMPVTMLIQTIFILVLLPLIIGMLIKKRWADFAEKATPFFSALGMIAVLFIGVGGVISNLEVFGNIGRNLGITGFLVFFSLTALGMIVGGLVPKILHINNYQTRAISMEIGIRNVALGMTIALLIQDRMGDFNSHMFAVSGIFALFMYASGIIAIFTYKKLLRVETFHAN